MIFGNARGLSSQSCCHPNGLNPLAFNLEKCDELRVFELMFLVRLLIIATPESEDSQDPDRAFTEISSLTEPEFHCPMA